MRRALLLFFLLIFAATSEGATLCLTMPSSTYGSSHDCCRERAMSPASVATCCAMSNPDRSSRPSSMRTSGVPVALAARVNLLFRRGDAGASVHSRASSGCDGRPVPLYLQHLSLLI